MKTGLLGRIIALLPIIIAACAPAQQTAPLLPIKVQLASTHQAVYGGFYAAVQRGYYTREGLDVSFIPGETNSDPTGPILDNSVQFGIVGASTLISERAAGKSVRALAIISRRDPVVFYSLTNSGIV